MINSASETLIPIWQASDFIPGRPHRSTVDRWRRRGVKGVKLGTFLIGGRRFTSRQALQQFFESVDAVDQGGEIKPRTASKRLKEHRAATRRLRDAGILK